MELPRLFNHKKTPPPQVFLALQIQDDQVRAAIWQIIDAVPQIISLGSLQTYQNPEELITAADNSLAHAFEKVKLEVDPDQVILGLPESWLDSSKIASDYTPLIKELLTKLELKPMGFVSISEAVIQYLRNKEGIPPTIILLELLPTKVFINLVKTGQVTAHEEVVRSQDLGEDVAEGLSRINQDQLPPRILLVNGQDNAAHHQLISYPLSDTLSFAHLPKVDILDPDFIIKSVALAGGTEAARSLGFSINQPAAESPQTSESTAPQPKTSSSDFGFLVDQDITQTDSPPEHDSSTPPEELEPEPETEPDLDLSSQPVADDPETSSLDSQVSPSQTPPLASPSRLKLPSLPHLPKLGLPRFPSTRKKFYFLIAALVILILAPLSAYLIYNQFATARISIEIKPQTVTQNLTFAIGDNTHPDLPTLSATSEEVELQDQASTSTSGETLIGEKSTGQVTIFNKTDSTKTLAAGTTLSTSAGLKVVLDDEVSVASRSASETADGLNITYGKADAAVTAAKIGADYNLPANTEFSVGDFPKSSLDAKALAELSGGFSQSVKAVSQDDQDKLLEELTQKLKSQAQDKLAPSSQGQRVLPLDQLSIKDENFNHDVGDQADNLTLDLTATIKLFRFSQSDLEQLILSQLSSQIPPGFDADFDTAQIDLSDPQAQDGFLITTATIKLPLLPQVSIPDYQQQLTGRSVEKAQNLLKNINGFESGKISINPPFPFLSNYLPRNKNHILIDIKAIR